MNERLIPSYVQPFLWSYDINKLDLAHDKKRIISNVLNLGTEKATKWLLEVYNRDEIKEAVSNPLPGEWNKKSLNFWGLVFGVKPNDTKRQLKHSAFL